MTSIYLIRHGQAAASFTDDADPGLSELGQQQAMTAAEALSGLGALTVVSSPLKRARQTAEAYRHRQAGQQAGSILIEERVSEIPSFGLGIEERGPWLREIMTGHWSEQRQALQAWRQTLIDCLQSQSRDCAIFSHFVAINVAVGYAEGNDAVIVFRPDNASITELATDGTSLSLIARGAEAVTQVN